MRGLLPGGLISTPQRMCSAGVRIGVAQRALLEHGPESKIMITGINTTPVPSVSTGKRPRPTVPMVCLHRASPGSGGKGGGGEE